MTDELHLKIADSSRNKGLALATNEHEDSECDEEKATMLVRRFKKFFGNIRYANQRYSKQKKPSNTMSDYGCHWCGSTDHFIKDCPTWKIEKGKGMARETGRQPTKGTPSKTDIRKALIAAWGESEREEETENPVEETTNLGLMVSHDSKTMKSKEKEVMSSSSYPKYLKSINKNQLIKLLVEIQEKLEENNTMYLQIEKDLKISKDHFFFVNSFRFDVQNKLFNFLD